MKVWDLLKKIVLYSYAHIPRQGHQVHRPAPQKIFNRILVNFFCASHKLITLTVAPALKITNSVEEAARLFIYFWNATRAAQRNSAYAVSVVEADHEASYSSGDEAPQLENSQLPLSADVHCTSDDNSSRSVANVELINPRATNEEALVLLHFWESARVYHDNGRHISLTYGQRSDSSSNVKLKSSAESMKFQQFFPKELVPGDFPATTSASSRNVNHLRATEEEAELLLYFWKSGRTFRSHLLQDNASSSSPDGNLEQAHPEVEEYPSHHDQFEFESLDRVFENRCPLSEFGTGFIDDVMNDMKPRKPPSSTSHVPPSIRPTCAIPEDPKVHRRTQFDSIMTAEKWNEAYREILREFLHEVYDQGYQNCDDVEFSFSSLDHTSQHSISVPSSPLNPDYEFGTATQPFTPFNIVSEEAQACWKSIPDHSKTIEHWNAGFNENIRQMQMGPEEDKPGHFPDPFSTIADLESQSEDAESDLEFFQPPGISNFKEEFEDFHKSPDVIKDSSHWRTSSIGALLDLDWKDAVKQPSDKPEVGFTPIPPDFPSSHERNLSLCSSIGSSSSLSSVSTQQSPIIPSPTLISSNTFVSN